MTLALGRKLAVVFVLLAMLALPLASFAADALPGHRIQVSSCMVFFLTWLR